MSNQKQGHKTIGYKKLRLKGPGSGQLLYNTVNSQVWKDCCIHVDISGGNRTIKLSEDHKGTMLSDLNETIFVVSVFVQFKVKLASIEHSTQSTKDFS